eukprot:TRINITY_DN1815_c0_g1_i2.p1 TRINITY_DN1815_c0_g1~~TRINITY_DN1815_c0_g1_i2.p1  ORF type:complete len:117 (+),score=12.18 TRINITY_DN1815_c0_g1_i2:122-472(+)
MQYDLRKKRSPWMFFISQMAIFSSLILMMAWIFGFKGGLSQSVASWPWNLHPFFMSLAFIFCMGQAIVSFSILPINHQHQKHLHAFLQTLALVLVLAGAWAALQYHVRNNVPHFYR